MKEYKAYKNNYMLTAYDTGFIAIDDTKKNELLFVTQNFYNDIVDPYAERLFQNNDFQTLLDYMLYAYL